MNFVNSFLLWSAAGAALPVLIHMLNREKPKKVYIPTVQFIIKAVQKSSGSRKLNNFMLLLMRMLILLCISLIIARPQIEKFLTAQKKDQIHAVIIIDNSYYTIHKNNTSHVIDDIKTKAKDIVNSLPTGSMISIMTAEENDNEFTEIKEYITEKIDQLSPAPVKTDIHSLIISADEMLKDFDSSVEGRIYVISDMNRGAWDSNYQLDNIKPENIYLNPMPSRVGNVYIADVDVKSTGFTKSRRVFKRRETEIQVKIGGDRNLAGMKVKLVIQDQDVDEKVILSDDQEITLVFNTSFDKEGLYFCEVKIETQDSIEVDNTFYFNVNVLEPVKIFLVNDRKSINPLIYRAALSPSGWHGKQKFNIELLSYSRVQTKLQEETPGLVILCGSLSFENNEWQALLRYIEQGGKAIICPDQYTQFSNLNQTIFPILNSKIIPVEKEAQLSLSANEEWKGLLDIPQLYETKLTHFFSYEKEPENESTVIPIRTNEGKPCLAIHSVKEGKVAFWGVSPELEFSDFLNNDSFPLLWHALVEKMTDQELLQKNLLCGLPVDVYALKGEIEDYQIQSPAGTKDNLPGASFNEVHHNIYQSQFDQTYIPGHYLTNSTIFKGFSCNMERTPEFFSFPEKNEFKHLMVEKTADSKDQMIKSAFGPDGLLIILILAALFFMVIEVHLGNKNYYAGD